MLIRQTRKAHPELDLDACAELFSKAAAEKELRGDCIASPWHIYAAETLRARHQLAVGDSFPADVFVFGQGEPENPAGTKIGGRPYWPADRPWPNGRDGKPAMFIGQFNFADSVDIIGDDLPGDVLVLAADSESDWLYEADALTFHWLTDDGSPPATDLDVASVTGSTAFYGIIHRTADYPYAFETAMDPDVQYSYLLPVLSATKIGGLPHFIQCSADTEALYLCQLTSIQPAAKVVYPFVNREQPLDLSFDNGGIYGDQNSLVLADMGTIYLFIDDNGNISHDFESH